MSIYDDILAELKITNEEIQLIRVTLERIDQRAAPPPLRGIEAGRHTRCNVTGCATRPSIIVGNSPYCADHAKGA